METRNLAGDPDYAAILTELRRRTDELQAEYGGPYTTVR